LKECRTVVEPPEDSPEPRRTDRRVETDVFYSSRFTLRGRLRSFRHALVGIWFVVRSQHNAWLHAIATVLALVLAVALNIAVPSRRFGVAEWGLLVEAIVLVWVAETFNTGLEVLAAAITSERHPIVKIAKDVAAAAVLLAALGAFIVGCILFLPPLWTLVARLF
jgi:diacylglycerol kinase (ATP)